MSSNNRKVGLYELYRSLSSYTRYSGRKEAKQEVINMLWNNVVMACRSIVAIEDAKSTQLTDLEQRAIEQANRLISD